jgi:hypothetical protein
MKSKIMLLFGAACVIASASSSANEQTAQCVSKLSPDGQLIYKTTLPELSTSSDLRATVRAKTIELAGAGRISQSEAPNAALAAAACLELVRR